MMTKKQQRIAIAEWVGWQWIKSQNADTWAWFDPNHERQTCWCDFEPAKLGYLPFKPDEDLNAMHEAEKKLSMGQLVTYGQLLNRMELSYNYGYVEQVINATAAQRSEALCRTLWPERFETTKGEV